MAASPKIAVVAVAGKEEATAATVQTAVVVAVNGKELATVANAGLAHVYASELALPLAG